MCKDASESTVLLSSNKRPLVIGCQETESEIGIFSHKLLYEKKKSMCTYILAEPYTLSMNGFASSGVN